MPKGNYSVIPNPNKKLISNEFAAEMQSAAQLEVAGRIQEAEGVYQQILDSRFAPKNGDEYPYMHIVRMTAQTGQWLPLQSESCNLNIDFNICILTTVQSRGFALML